MVNGPRHRSIRRYGNAGMATPIWLRRYGYAGMATPVWQRRYGNACMATPVWQRRYCNEWYDMATPVLQRRYDMATPVLYGNATVRYVKWRILDRNRTTRRCGTAHDCGERILDKNRTTHGYGNAFWTKSDLIRHYTSLLGPPFGGAPRLVPL